MGAAGASRNLALATVAFAVAFVGWSLISPLAKTFQDDLDLSNTKTLLLTAVPVVLGSLMRGPCRWASSPTASSGRIVFTLCCSRSRRCRAVLFGYADG